MRSSLLHQQPTEQRRYDLPSLSASATHSLLGIVREFALVAPLALIVAEGEANLGRY